MTVPLRPLITIGPDAVKAVTSLLGAAFAAGKFPEALATLARFHLIGVPEKGIAMEAARIKLRRSVFIPCISLSKQREEKGEQGRPVVFVSVNALQLVDNLGCLLDGMLFNLCLYFTDCASESHARSGRTTPGQIE